MKTITKSGNEQNNNFWPPRKTREKRVPTGGTKAWTPVPDPLDPFFCFFLLLGPGAGAGAGAVVGTVGASSPAAFLSEEEKAFLGGDGLVLPPPADELDRFRLPLPLFPPPPSLSDIFQCLDKLLTRIFQGQRGAEGDGYGYVGVGN